MRERKEELGIQMNIGAIIKKAKETENPSIEKKTEKKFYPMPIKVTQELLDKYVKSYYSLMKQLDEEIVMTRSETFIFIMKHMYENLDIDISSYQDFYDKYIGIKGKRRINTRTIPANTKVVNCVWGNFTKEQLQMWKNLLTKLAIKEGLEKKYDFSKQYFISDIVDYLSDNIEEIALYIREHRARG